MENKAFGQDMKKTRTLFYLAVLIMFLFGLVAALLFFFGGDKYLLYVTITSGLAIVVFLAALILFYLFYTFSPEVKQRREINRSIDKNLKKIPAASKDLADAQAKITGVKGYFQGKVAEEDQKLANLVETVRQAVAAISADKEQELSSTLANLQKSHLEAGLREIPLDAAKVPGIGDVLLETLKTASINTALDVTHEAVDAIPGFGESKALSLLRWRESLEYPLRESQPSLLPQAVSDEINGKYGQLITAQHEGLARFQAERDAAVTQLQEKERNELSPIEQAEAAARQELDRLEAETGNLQSQVTLYRGITFPRFLVAVLRGLQENWQKKSLSLLLYILFFLLGFANIVLLVLAYLQFRRLSGS